MGFGLMGTCRKLVQFRSDEMNPLKDFHHQSEIQLNPCSVDNFHKESKEHWSSFWPPCVLMANIYL